MVKQTKIILAYMALHNFIRESSMADADFERCDNDENFMPIPIVCSSQENGDEEQGMNEFVIALQLLCSI
jgi:hypothetical protein